MSQRTKDQNVFFVLILMLTFVLTACSGAAQPTSEPAATEATEALATEAPVQSGSLTVLEWAGYEIPEMWADFGNTYPDANVTFNFGGSDPDIYGKVLAGSSEDIIHMYTP